MAVQGTRGFVRVAAMGDLHYGKTSRGTLTEIFTTISNSADVLLLCGDSTDFGLPEEALVLVEDLRSSVQIPIVAVLGNHDFESAGQEEISRIFDDAGIFLLDGTAVELHGIAFAGVKGFAGGFGRRALQPWGEGAIKNFVKEAVDEAAKLENALTSLGARQIVVLLHYSPIKDTVEGEDPETYAFLGSSRLEEPLKRRELVAVFHGHAHKGKPEGHIQNGTPVYNVAKALLERSFPDHMPYRLIQVPCK